MDISIQSISQLRTILRLSLLSFPVNHLYQLSLILILDFSIKYRGSIFNYFIASFLGYRHRQSREGPGPE